MKVKHQLAFNTEENILMVLSRLQWIWYLQMIIPLKIKHCSCMSKILKCRKTGRTRNSYWIKSLHDGPPRLWLQRFFYLTRRKCIFVQIGWNKKCIFVQTNWDKKCIFGNDVLKNLENIRFFWYCVFGGGNYV